MESLVYPVIVFCLGLPEMQVSHNVYTELKTACVMKYNGVDKPTRFPRFVTFLCSVSRPFRCFTRFHEGHFMLCYKEEF